MTPERRPTSSGSVDSADGSSVGGGGDGALPVRRELPRVEGGDTQRLADTATTLGGNDRDGAHAREAAALPGVGFELGPVKLMKEVGRGAMGVVFVGYHRLLGRPVAVKFLRYAEHDTPGDSPITRPAPHGRTARAGGAGDSPVTAAAGANGGGPWERFFGEARAAAAVRHPNLAEVYHADLAPGTGTPYLVFEYVDGPTLGRLLQQAGRFDPATALTVLADVAAGLAELHDRGVIHRDVKASNVLVDPAGRVVVTDFGLAVRRAGGLQQDEETAGTPGYMAPETFDGRASTRSDVYALGILAFLMLTGRLPFDGPLHEVRQKHQSTPLPADALRAAGASDALVEVLERAAHKQVVFRHKSAREFARAVAQLPGHTPERTAKARAELARLVQAVRGGAAPTAPGDAPPPAHTGSSTTVQQAHTAGSSGLSPEYTQTLARAAAVKRQRHAAQPLPEWAEREDALRAQAMSASLPTTAHGSADFPPASPPAAPADRGRAARIAAVVVAIVVVATLLVWFITR